MRRIYVRPAMIGDTLGLLEDVHGRVIKGLKRVTLDTHMSRAIKRGDAIKVSDAEAKKEIEAKKLKGKGESK
jgi:hypothetical protein